MLSSLIALSLAELSFSLSALLAICDIDSSPEIIKVLYFWDKFEAICSVRVDFPIPGSPESRVRDPTTRPSPVTLSNSWIPLIMRFLFSDITRFSGFIALMFLGVFEREGLLISSVNEFHASQVGHLPSHLPLSNWHSLQVYIDLVFIDWFFILLNFNGLGLILPYKNYI